MNIEGWKYYNHAAIPTTPPHIQPNTKPLLDNSIWKIGNGKRSALLARWETAFDCPKATNWWYIIKDSPFDISLINSKRRYVIKKGISNFEIKRIEPIEYKDEMASIAVSAFSLYPASYRPDITKKQYAAQISEWINCEVFGAFSLEDGTLCGFSKLILDGQCKHFDIQKVLPSCEKKEINAALIYGMLNFNESFLNNGGYICDGTRNVMHETAFQDYLEKYFLFRKAYCQLNILYRNGIRQVFHILYPFRNILKRLDSINVFHNINGVLKMEEIRRSK